MHHLAASALLCAILAVAACRAMPPVVHQRADLAHKRYSRSFAVTRKFLPGKSWIGKGRLINAQGQFGSKCWVTIKNEVSK